MSKNGMVQGLALGVMVVSLAMGLIGCASNKSGEASGEKAQTVVLPEGALPALNALPSISIPMVGSIKMEFRNDATWIGKVDGKDSVKGILTVKDDPENEGGKIYSAKPTHKWAEKAVMGRMIGSWVPAPLPEIPLSL